MVDWNKCRKFEAWMKDNNIINQKTEAMNDFDEIFTPDEIHEKIKAILEV